jgi:hypothetical protein
MSRRASFAALALSVALVAGSVVALVAGVAMGAWKPAGPVARPSTPANPGGVVSGAVEYGEFLDDVRAGRVADVYRDGDILQVNAEAGPYAVQLPPGDPDVYEDMEAAASAGGVPVPGFTTAGGPDEPREPVTYAELLELTRAGRVYDVFHEGDRLMVTAVDGPKDVSVPPDVDVLNDLEAAAAAGGVPPPAYTKIPSVKPS